MEASYLLILIVLLGGMALTIPVYLCLFFTAFVGFALFSDIPLIFLVQTLFRSMDNFALIVVLFFILCGNIMTAGSIVTKLIRFANVTVGWMPGGLAMAGVVACAMFGAISGSTVATVVAIGGFMIPALIENNYDEQFTIGVMTTSGNLGIIIPPSITMILYSMVSSCSLEGLFLTGFLPGITITAVMCGYCYYWAKKNPGFKAAPVPNLKEVWLAFKDSFWSLMLPVVIFAGIFSGAFTANEAAVVACVYALVVELFIHKTTKWGGLKKIMVNSAVTSASLLIIVAGATAFGKYLTIENIPTKLSELIVSTISQPWVFMLIMQIWLLIVGMFMDCISATLILTPIFLPMLERFDINVVHFGLLMTVNLAIGYCTPPLGVSLYITGAMRNKDLIYVTKGCMPFIIIQIAVLLLYTYWPSATLWLPRALGWNVD